MSPGSLGPKNDPPADLQEKVLTLIQSWADAFQQHPELQGVNQVYQELKSKGIEFPMTNLDTMAPILTPQRVHQKPIDVCEIRLIVRICACRLLGRATQQPRSVADRPQEPSQP